MGKKRPSAIRDAGDVYSLFRGLGKLKNERVYSVLLEGDDKVIGSMEISRGGPATWMSIHISCSIRPPRGRPAR